MNLPLPNCFTSSIKTARNDPVSSRSYISSNLRLKQLPFFTFLFMGWGGVGSYLLSLSSRFFPVFTMTCFPFTPPKRVHPISIPSPSGPARMGLGCWYSKTECLLSGSRCWQRWDRRRDGEAPSVLPKRDRSLPSKAPQGRGASWRPPGRRAGGCGFPSQPSAPARTRPTPLSVFHAPQNLPPPALRP